MCRGELPPGLTLDSATGVIAGTPTTGGIYTFTVEATDTQSHTASVTITISVVEPLAILTSTIPDAAVGVPYSVTVSARGGTAPYSWFYWGNPVPGLEVNAATGEISGIPTTPGEYETGVFVIDATATWVTQPYILIVT